MAVEGDKKVFKQLDNLKELQQHFVPELLKQIKAYESARAELTAAEERINEAWEKVATCVGGDNEWGKALKEISKRNDEILAIEKEWEGIVETSFVQMINKGLSQETKTTATKEKEVRKAITRMDQETKNTGKSTMKKKKVDAKAMDEYNLMVAETEKKKDMIASDVNHQCEMTYFMLLQSISKALKQKMEGYERIHNKSNEFDAYLSVCIKIQPDFANAPKPSVMKAIYESKKTKPDKKRSQTMSASSLGSHGLNNGSESGPSSEDGPKKGPIQYSRVAEQQSKGITTPNIPSPHPSTTKHASLYFDGPARPATSILDLPPAPVISKQPKAKAIWAFTPQKEGDLPMKQGEILTIVNSVGPWWMAENNGVVGRIPANYVELLNDSPPQLKLPPQMPMSAPGSISPRRAAAAAGTPKITPLSPIPTNTPLDLPPPVESIMGADIRSLPPIISPKEPPPHHPTTAPHLPSFPHDLPPPEIDFPTSFPHDLPPPAIDHLPPPMLDEEIAPPAPVRDPEPTTHTPVPLPLPTRNDPAPPATGQWQQFTTDQGYVYYFNAATGESKWTLD